MRGSFANYTSLKDLVTLWFSSSCGNILAQVERRQKEELAGKPKRVWRWSCA